MSIIEIDTPDFMILNLTENIEMIEKIIKPRRVENLTEEDCLALAKTIPLKMTRFFRRQLVNLIANRL